MTQPEPAFWFDEIAAFDARGLRRCRVPGCGISEGPGTSVVADFWRDRAGHVVMRMTWQGWRYHFRVVLAGGDQVPDDALDSLGCVVDDIMLEWWGEAPDDAPTVPKAPDAETERG